MKDQCNLMYSIFNEDVVISDSLLVNAIQGYEVIDKGHVVTEEDILNYFKKERIAVSFINYNTLWKFDNPMSGEEWYINKIMVAYKQRGQALPKIIMLCSERHDFLIRTDDFSTFQKWGKLFESASSITFASGIGSLSTPNYAVSNRIYADSTNRAKLPFVV